jgi:hypothetical protein
VENDLAVWELSCEREHVVSKQVSGQGGIQEQTYWHVKTDNIGNLQQFLQAAHILAFEIRLGFHGFTVIINHLHAPSLAHPPCNYTTNPTHPDNTQCLSFRITSEWETLFPLSGTTVLFSVVKVSHGAEDEVDCGSGGRVIYCSWGVGDGDAVLVSGGNVDVVVSCSDYIKGGKNICLSKQVERGETQDARQKKQVTYSDRCVYSSLATIRKTRRLGVRERLPGRAGGR